MEQTPNLLLPYIMPSQAQKHVTHNEAIRTLDALVHLAVLDRGLTAPPASAQDGDRYIVPEGSTEEWSDRDGMIAAWQDGGWRFLEPRTGWVAWVNDEALLLVFDGTGWASAGRETLAAPRTYYVRADGNDMNNGLADTASGAFATIQHAVDIVAALDLSIHGVTIQIGTGTYGSPVVLKSLTGAGSVTLRGNPSAPADVVIARAGSGACIQAVNVIGDWRIDGIRLTIASAGSDSWSLWANGPTTTLRYRNVDFGPSGRQVVAENGAFVRKEGPCFISGGGINHLFIRVAATYDANGGGDTTFIGAGLTANFSGQFAVCATGAVLYQPTGTYVNASAVTGVRYLVSRNAVIQKPGSGGEHYFPGNASGAVDSGGQYM